MTVRERFEDFADCLLVGLFVTLTALPVVTAPSGFAAACRVLASGVPPRLFFRELRDRWRSPADELLAGFVFGGLTLFLALDVGLALTVLPGSWLLRLAVVIVCVAAGALLLAVAARAGVSRISWRAALQWKTPKPMLMAVLVVAGVLVWTLPPIALVIGGPVAFAAAVVDK
ncbi:hypothetical protein Lesp02_16810 [Lentzea sp. NBRC 105346]|uniref:hypothetical protein n=1 Tax=Lentzea sp. NBRC 105346 TaxID=3032205 RepID=UPI0024A0BB47|nr:hypothetical protein [Lentzea sp. NBRC 105346]GLZ29491.1 hypothetical protein Lesp02_16810 [Lentzea sp. NBRC 105346]